MLTLLTKLPAHLERDITAKAITAQIIGTMRLDDSQIRHITGCHFFKLLQFLFPVQATRAKTIDRLVRAEVPL